MTTLVPWLNVFGRWLFENLWGMSIELAVMATVVLAVIFLLRVRAPKIRHMFWGLILAKPVVTFLIASPLSLYWFLHPPAEAPRPQRPAIERQASAFAGTSAAEFAYVTRPRVAPAMHAPMPVAAWRTLDCYGAMALIWILAAALLAMRLAAGCVYVNSLRRHARLLGNGQVVAILDEAAQAMRMRRRVRVAVSAAVHGPVLAGVVRPVILLPERVAREMAPEQIRYILAHELAHVRRWDNLVLLVQRLAEMLLFFHPAVWLCGWAMRREAESACDGMVIAVYGTPAEYADSLTRVAEMREGLTRRLLVNTFAAAESNLAKRVRRILRGNPGKTAAALTAASICALIVIGCLGLPTAAERKSNPAIRGTGENKGDKLMSKPVHTTASNSASTQAAQQVAKPSGKHPASAMLTNLPCGQGQWTAIGGGLWVMLKSAGVEADYETINSDVGQAFILQASDQVAKYDGALDIGWWPLDPACTRKLLELAGPIWGIQFKWHEVALDVYKIDPAKCYRDHLEEAVKASISAGRPALQNHAFWRVVAGYDNEPLPPFSFCPVPRDGQQKIERSDRYPWIIVTFDKADRRFDRKQSDIEALKRAVALGHDQIPMPGGFLTGQKAFALWASTLRDVEHPGQARWHANVVGVLRENRRCAIQYLRNTAGRHSQKTAEHLNTAADLYEKVLSELKQADISEQALIKSTDGREKLAQLAERVAALEAKAVDEIQGALAEEDVTTSVAYGTVGPDAVTNPRTKLARDGGAVWIEGALNYENSDPNLSHIRTLACYLRNKGHDVDFDWLMAGSGEAFCYYYHPDGTFLSAMVHSYDVANAVLGLYGYRGRWEDAAVANDAGAIIESLETRG